MTEQYELQDNYFQQHLALIKNRWPKIAKLLSETQLEEAAVEYLASNSDTLIFHGIQLSSSYDIEAEVALQCQQIPQINSIANVYGTGLGFVQQQLLKRKNLKQLNIHILNLHVFKASLQYFQQCNWLTDNRVNLIFSDNNKQVDFPFVALPAELVLAEDKCASIRDRVQLELDHQFIQQNNGVDNIDTINALKNNIELIQLDRDIAELPKASQDTIYLVAGAGPTLEYHYKWLKTLHNNNCYKLIAVDAAVKPLLKNDIIPDYIVSIDRIADGLFKDVDFEKIKEVPLIYFPLLATDFLKSWLGKRYVSYSTALKYFDFLPIKTTLYCSGSVIHPAIDLAVKMQAKTIILLGADFSLVNQKTHAAQTQILSERELLKPDETPHWLLNGLNERVPTYLNFRGYLRDLELYIRQIPNVKFYNGSLHGAKIEGAPLWEGFYD